jgi:hypothetical protein
MDGLDEYKELAVKKVHFLDTKSDNAPNTEKEEFVPIINYSNTILNKKETIKKIEKKPKKVIKKKKNFARKNKPKKVESTTKKGNRERKTNKIKKVKPNRVQNPVKKSIVKKNPAIRSHKPSKKTQKGKNPKKSTTKKSIQNNTSINNDSSMSEVEFKYDSESDSNSIDLNSNQPKRINSHFHRGSENNNRKSIINAFKKKNKIGRKSFYRTLDFDNKKQKVSRNDVVKNKQKSMILENQKKNKYNESTPNSSKTQKNLEKKINNLLYQSQVPKKTSFKSKTNLHQLKNQLNQKKENEAFTTPPSANLKKIYKKPKRSSLTSISQIKSGDANEKKDTVVKKKAQPWKTSIKDQIQKLKEGLDAKAFIVYESISDTILLSNNPDEVREMASLTKIMTCYTTLKFCSKHLISMKDEYFIVTPKAAGMNGTSADLMSNTYVSIEDLLRGLMLPSGNDAAICIAENIGRLIRLQTDSISNFQIYSGYDSLQPDFLNFIKLMNQNAQELELHNSHFANPHGLNHVNNTSTCEDLLKLSLEAMKLPKFQEIVKTVEYTGMFMKKTFNCVGRSNTENITDKSKIDLKRKEILKAIEEDEKKKRQNELMMLKSKAEM